MNIYGRPVGDEHSPYLLAEISGEHRGDVNRLMALVDAAVDGGADGIKLQAFDPERLAKARGGIDYVVVDGPWAGKTLGEIYRATHTSRELIEAVFERLRRSNVAVVVSAFSVEDVDYLEGIGCHCIKVASFEATNGPLLRRAGLPSTPVILSTGMASVTEICLALDEIRHHDDAKEVAILHCVSAYPCPPEQADLRRISKLRRIFNCSPIGFSDHTLGPECAIAAVALGASIIEKHITLDRNDGGLDASFSMEPAEFRQMVSAIRNVHAALQPPKGDGEAIYRELRSGT